MKNINITFVAFLFPILQSCASGGITSPYFQPSPEIAYRYGNFCGDNHPSGQQTLDRVERVDYLRSIKPIDSVDTFCQIHDLCYAKTINDNFHCDTLISDLLTGFGFNSWQGTPQQESQCNNLTGEMDFAFTYLLKRVEGEGWARGASITVGPAVATLSGGFHSATVAMSGFPLEGSCFLREEAMQARLNRALPDYVRAIAHAQSIEDQSCHNGFGALEQCFLDRTRVLREEITIDDMF